MKIKSYDNYKNDKIISTSAIKNLTSNKIIFDDGSELTLKEILSSSEKYGICEINKINAIYEFLHKINN